MKEKILAAVNSPKDLESLYHENPEEFKQAFLSVLNEYPDSVILLVWQERLNYETSPRGQKAGYIWSYKNLLLIISLTAIFGTIFKIPNFFDTINIEGFYSRNVAAIFILSLMCYFFFQKPHSKSSIAIILGISGCLLIYLNFLPGAYVENSYRFFGSMRAFKDAINVAELHIPILLWLLLGTAFTGIDWKSTSGRIGFLRYNGEAIIYTTILLIGGMILTGITFSLLSLIDDSYNLIDWYTENIIPYGIVASPIVATFLIEKIFSRRLNVAPVIGKIFAPLFLITAVLYLILMAVYQNNPYSDREDLIAFNILLIVVLGLLMFSIAERESDVPIGFSDYINIGLVLTTLTIDIIALFAVLFRSNDAYGFTPNRIAVLGINLMVFGHLAGILYFYLQFVLNKGTFAKLENWVAGYLPAYAIGALAISIALPLIFWYR